MRNKRITINPINGILALSSFFIILYLMNIGAEENIFPISFLVLLFVYFGHSFFLLLFIVLISIYEVFKLEQVKSKNPEVFNSAFDEQLFNKLYS